MLLKDSYGQEKQTLAKLAPSLNPKSLNLSSTEQQSVPLMLLFLMKRSQQDWITYRTGAVGTVMSC